MEDFQRTVSSTKVKRQDVKCYDSTYTNDENYIIAVPTTRVGN